MMLDPVCEFLAVLPDDAPIRPHERHAVVANVAAFIAVMRHYSERPWPWSAEDWRDEYLAQLGAAPPFQRDGVTAGALDFSEIGTALPGDNHVLKPAAQRPDDLSLLLGLIATTCRTYCGVGTATGSRAGQVVVTPTDGSIRSEVEAIVAATKVSGGSSARDHMTWLLPGSDKRTVLASPVIDVGIGVDLSTLVKRKISTVLAGGASDPQSALLLRKSAAAPMSATDKSPWRWKLILGALVDGIATSASAVSRAAPILGSAHGLPAVRISCLQTGQGRTVGYRELLLPLPPEAARRLRLAQRGESIDPTAMVKAQIAAIEDLQRRLRRALWHLHGQPDRTSPLSDLIAAASNRFTDAAGWALVHGLPGLLSGSAPPDFGAIARHYLARALLTVADPLRRARAELSYQKGPPPMTEAPDLLSRVARTISHWRQSLTPKDCAELRSGAETMALWACLSSIRDDELAATEGVWRIAILHVATKPKGGPAAGRALALSDYPEPRLLSLLAARDPGQVEQAIAWLKAREQAADVSQLVACALAEVLGDDAARNWLRRRIAIDFVRSGSEASLDRRGADTEEAAATV